MSAILTPPLPASTLSTSGCRPFRFNREQYHHLGRLGFFDGKKVELIRGEIFEMSPKNWPPVVGCRKTADALERVFAGRAWVSRQDPVNLDASEPEPDVMAVAGKFEDYADHPTTALLIVEVADTTFVRDTTTKAEMYAEAMILDYWVLDLENRRLLVYRDPAPHAAGGTAYRSHLTLGPSDTVSPLASPSAAIAVADLLP
jgi:Uma2 family endonuclease